MNKTSINSSSTSSLSSISSTIFVKQQQPHNNSLNDISRTTNINGNTNNSQQVSSSISNKGTSNFPNDTHKNYTSKHNQEQHIYKTIRRRYLLPQTPRVKLRLSSSSDNSFFHRRSLFNLNSHMSGITSQKYKIRNILFKNQPYKSLFTRLSTVFEEEELVRQSNNNHNTKSKNFSNANSAISTKPKEESEKIIESNVVVPKVEISSSIPKDNLSSSPTSSTKTIIATKIQAQNLSNKFVNSINSSNNNLSNDATSITINTESTNEKNTNIKDLKLTNDNENNKISANKNENYFYTSLFKTKRFKPTSYYINYVDEANKKIDYSSYLYSDSTSQINPVIKNATLSEATKLVEPKTAKSNKEQSDLKLSSKQNESNAINMLIEAHKANKVPLLANEELNASLISLKETRPNRHSANIEKITNSSVPSESKKDQLTSTSNNNTIIHARDLSLDIKNYPRNKTNTDMNINSKKITGRSVSIVSLERLKNALSNELNSYSNKNIQQESETLKNSHEQNNPDENSTDSKSFISQYPDLKIPIKYENRIHIRNNPSQFASLIENNRKTLSHRQTNSTPIELERKQKSTSLVEQQHHLPSSLSQLIQNSVITQNLSASTDQNIYKIEKEKNFQSLKTNEFVKVNQPQTVMLQSQQYALKKINTIPPLPIISGNKSRPKTPVNSANDPASSLIIKPSILNLNEASLSGTNLRTRTDSPKLRIISKDSLPPKPNKIHKSNSSNIVNQQELHTNTNNSSNNNNVNSNSNKVDSLKLLHQNNLINASNKLLNNTTRSTVFERVKTPPTSKAPSPPIPTTTSPSLPKVMAKKTNIQVQLNKTISHDPNRTFSRSFENPSSVFNKQDSDRQKPYYDQRTNQIYINTISSKPKYLDIDNNNSDSNFSLNNTTNSYKPEIINENNFLVKNKILTKSNSKINENGNFYYTLDQESNVKYNFDDYLYKPSKYFDETIFNISETNPIGKRSSLIVKDFNLEKSDQISPKSDQPNSEDFANGNEEFDEIPTFFRSKSDNSCNNLKCYSENLFNTTNLNTNNLSNISISFNSSDKNGNFYNNLDQISNFKYNIEDYLYKPSSQPMPQAQQQKYISTVKTPKVYISNQSMASIHSFKESSSQDTPNSISSTKISNNVDNQPSNTKMIKLTDQLINLALNAQKESLASSSLYFEPITAKNFNSNNTPLTNQTLSQSSNKISFSQNLNKKDFDKQIISDSNSAKAQKIEFLSESQMKNINKVNQNIFPVLKIHSPPRNLTINRHLSNSSIDESKFVEKLTNIALKLNNKTKLNDSTNNLQKNKESSSLTNIDRTTSPGNYIKINARNSYCKNYNLEDDLVDRSINLIDDVSCKLSNRSQNQINTTTLDSLNKTQEKSIPNINKQIESTSLKKLINQEQKLNSDYFNTNELYLNKNQQDLPAPKNISDDNMFEKAIMADNNIYSSPSTLSETEEHDSFEIIY